MLIETLPLACPVGGADDVEIFLEIPQVPVLCNVLSDTREAARAVPRGDLRLGFSPTSGHVYNYAFDAARLAYSQKYENSLHFSPRFQSYAATLVDHLIERFDLRGRDVVELGCGKGDFLQMLCERGGNRGLGFDPSYVPAPEAEEAARPFTVVRDLYSERYADHEADLVCCRHVLEHVEQPRAFLETVRRALGGRRDTAVFFEVPNVVHTLEHLAIWDLIYEHCSYFSPASLAYLFETSGFDVEAVTPVFGGQFVTVEARLAADASPGITAGTPARTDETAALAHAATTFAGRFRDKVAHWEATLEGLARAGRRAVVWGAGSKGVTILNLLSTAGCVDAVVDINPRKQGRYVAGTGHAIVAPADLKAHPPDDVIVTNPLYADEIRAMLAAEGLSPALRFA